MKVTPETFEALAAQEHVRWSEWMLYQFKQGIFKEDGTWIMPAWAVTRWRHQALTPYVYLHESEKESDRKEVRRILESLE